MIMLPLFILIFIENAKYYLINDQNIEVLAVSIFKFNAEKVIKYACVLLTRTLTVTLN